jgi:beta-galactosidase/beta-glucuronidase
LPDRWRFAFDEADAGNERGFHRADFNDASWPLVATRDTTLDAQGYDKTTVLWYRTHFSVPPKHDALTLFFGEVDGTGEVFVNGTKIAVPSPPANEKAAKNSVAPTREGLAKSRVPFEVDVTAAVHPGENILALRVDHTKMTDLALGGILRPVVLVEKPKP